MLYNLASSEDRILKKLKYDRKVVRTLIWKYFIRCHTKEIAVVMDFTTLKD